MRGYFLANTPTPMSIKYPWKQAGLVAAALAACSPSAFASESDIKIPDLSSVKFFDGALSGNAVLMIGLAVCVVATIYGWIQYLQTKNLQVHSSMAAVSQIIWETCKTYLFQQGKFLASLWILIAVCMVYYFGVLSHNSAGHVVVILLASILGILGSYGVAWFGIRINTVANSRAAFSALKGNALATLLIPLKSGMSVGLLLVAIELFFMICILAFLPSELAGPCFIGFAIGESLGASALRICGGIFTKIADIGADLMKIVFNLPEDDPRNPGVIADCTGDNAGDSVGPTADGFETYGVTGVALIAFLALALAASPALCATLIVWLFAMRILMVLTSLVSYWINDAVAKAIWGRQQDFNLELPLTNLVWITSIVSILVTYAATYLLLGKLDGQPGLWWVLSTIISLGTIAGALIPEFTKVFTSTESRHVKEVVTSSRQGGASLNILSGLVAGNFSAFWTGLCILVLMFGAYYFSGHAAVQAMMPAEFRFAAPIFAFGLVAFGFPRHGAGHHRGRLVWPRHGQRPVRLRALADRGQARHRGRDPEGLRLHARLRGRQAPAREERRRRQHLQGHGQTGAHRHRGRRRDHDGLRHHHDVERHLSRHDREALARPSRGHHGPAHGGAVIYWFTGASTQAVVTGAYRAVVYIKDNMKLDATTAATEASKEVVKICTQYAQKGMINIFIVIFCFSLSLAFFDPFFFIGYLVGMAFFGLFRPSSWPTPAARGTTRRRSSRWNSR